jgi:hypothetical protein
MRRNWSPPARGGLPVAQTTASRCSPSILEILHRLVNVVKTFRRYPRLRDPFKYVRHIVEVGFCKTSLVGDLGSCIASDRLGRL